jgi:hypothetical protein
MSTMLQNVRDLTREAWDTEEFGTVRAAVALELETAARKGRFWTVLLYSDKPRAQAVVSWLTQQGFKCTIKTQDEKGQQFGNSFVSVAWGPE